MQDASFWEILLSTIFILLYSITIIGLIVVIIAENRNPLKTIPWVVVLLLAPGVGILFYFFFGQELSNSHEPGKYLTMHAQSRSNIKD